MKLMEDSTQRYAEVSTHWVKSIKALFAVLDKGMNDLERCEVYDLMAEENVNLTTGLRPQVNKRERIAVRQEQMQMLKKAGVDKAKAHTIANDKVDLWFGTHILDNLQQHGNARGNGEKEMIVHAATEIAHVPLKKLGEDVLPLFSKARQEKLRGLFDEVQAAIMAQFNDDTETAKIVGGAFGHQVSRRASK